MTKRLLVAALFLALGSAPGAEPIKLTEEELSATRPLLGDMYGRGRAFEYLEVLADELGPRLTGSPQYERSVQ